MTVGLTGGTGGSRVEDETSPETTHDLLLSLAGRVDDDLLAWARELAAVGEDARAVELLTASLVAARAVLPEPVRAGLVAAARSARTDLDPAAALPPSRAEQGSAHRFDAGPPDDVVSAVLLAVPPRQLQGCRILVARRLTPAGSAPGPLPHPVVLVEVMPGARATDVLAYQLAVTLERAGVPASVEVLTADAPVPAYHAAALRSARLIRSDDGGERHMAEPEQAPGRPSAVFGAGPPSLPGHRHTRHPLAPPQPDVAGLLGTPARQGDLRGDPRPAPTADALPQRAPAPNPEPVDPEAGTLSMPAVPNRATPLSAVRPEAGDPPVRRDAEPSAASVDPQEGHAPPAPPGPSSPPGQDPRPRPGPTARTQRPPGTPDARPPLPSPIPLLRRNGPTPTAHLFEPIVEQPGEAAEQPSGEQIQRPAEAVDNPRLPRNTAMDTPLPPRKNGLSRTLGETPAFDSLNDPLSGPLSEPLLAPLLDPTIREDDPLGVDGRMPADEPEPTRVQEDWSSEWQTGSWAMSPSALDDDEPEDTSVASDETAAPDVEERPDARPAPRRAARHRYVDEKASATAGEGRPPEAEAEAPRGRSPEAAPAPAPEPVAEPVAEDAPTAAPEPDGTPDPGPEPADLGLRPESLARLSDADRQLLARLQAELLDGRKPRVSRRAGIANGSGTNGSNGNGSGINGNPRADPPDLAG
jgi:hypothetical protein